ncbi:MAG: right-handed parallel beta-helix repeat-containing protein [Flavobacteriales bacterium]|nr:right-handed parallel beta-helix repeat-containing protein [Flavobacteriales bacterium]
MKKGIVFFLLTLATGAFAQFYTDTTSLNFWQLKALNDAHFDSIRIERELQGIFDMKGTGYGKYRKWVQYWTDFMPADGNFSVAAEASQALYLDQFSTAQNQQIPNPGSVNAPPLAWEEVGPFNYSKIKKWVNNQWINPHQQGMQNTRFDGGVGLFDRILRHPTNNQMLFTSSSEGGGLFYSEDNGETWKSGGTDKIPQPKITAIAAKPGTNSVWVIGLMNGAVYLTANKGVTWKCINAADVIITLFGQQGNTLQSDSTLWMLSSGNNLYNERESTYDLHFSQTGDTLFAAGFNGLYYCPNYTSANRVWRRYTITAPYPLNPVYPDYEFLNFSALFKHHRNNTDYWFAVGWVYSAKNKSFVDTTLIPPNANKRVRWYSFYVSTDQGATWQNLPLPQNIMQGHFRTFDEYRTAAVKVDAAKNARYVHFSMPNDLNNRTHLLLFDIQTNQWSYHQTILGPNPRPHWSPHAFAVNQLNLSGKEAYVFNNEYIIYNWPDSVNPQILDPGYGNKFHPDVRALHCDLDGTWWLATDGGLYKSADGFQTFVPKSEGLNASEPSAHFGLAQKKPYLVGAGYWHSGIQMYNPDDNENWHHWSLGDGWYGLFDFNNPNLFLSYDQGNSPRRLTTGYNTVSTTSFTGGQVFSAAGSELTQGLIYTKFYQIKRSPDFGATSNLSTLPVDGTPSFYGDTIKRNGALYLAPSDDNILYVQDFFTSDTTGTDRLLKVTDAAGAGNTYTSIPITQLASFVDEAPMCIDERNPHRFWIANPNPVKETASPYYGKKIWEYHNGSFTDITHTIAGKPDFPWYISISSIARDRETGILYIGTNNGIYYLDTDGTPVWRLYSQNIPFARATLKINHCEGYLYASSFRRGIWKAPLIRSTAYDTPLEPDPGAWEITGTGNVWNGRINLFRDVVVKTGAELTVTGEVYVYGRQKIVVEPGAILRINGGRITDGCGYPWQGIQLWGNSAQPQTEGPGGFYPQARLVMGNATLENAENAVTTWKPEDWTKTGGLIQASNSTFRNNRRSVELRYYTHPDKSRFTGCTFVTDGPVAGGNLHTQHMVTAENISGTRFTGCVFECTDMNLPLLPVGIYTHNARFEVVPGTTSQVYPPPPASLVPTRFKGLRAGIEALNGSTRNFTVDTALFENCYYGVLTQNVNHFEVMRSRFALKAQGVFGYRAIGIQNSHGSLFKIENNRFINPDTDPQDYRIYGIYTDNSGGASNEIYNNLYTGMQVANLSTRSNWSPKGSFTGAHGLRYRCNVQDSGKSDILIATGTIGKNQGTVTTNPLPPFNLIFNPAGNTFSAAPLPTGHIRNNGTQTIQYVHHNQNGSPWQVEPVEISALVDKVQATENLINRAAYCPSRLPAPTVQVRKELAEALLLNHKPDFDDAAYVYLNLLDGGNTGYLINSVEYAWSQQTWELRGELLNLSPFLSMEVLYEVANNTDVLPHAVQLEVFMANPHCVRDREFMEYLEEKDLPMPGWMINLLTGQANTRTLKDELENRMAYHAYPLEYARAELGRLIHADTLLYAPDSLLLHTLGSGGGEHHIFAARTLAELENFEEALHVTDSLLTIKGLPATTGRELTVQKQFIALLQKYRQQGMHYSRLDTASQQELSAFADSGNLAAQQAARNILCFYYGYEYLPQVPEEVPEPKKGKNNTTNSASGAYAHSLVKVYPNPAQRHVVFEYRLPSASGAEARLEIFNLKGNIVYSGLLSGQEGVFVWNPEYGIPAGDYPYRVSMGAMVIQSGLIQLIR